MRVTFFSHSHILNRILVSPGIPWNADVALLAVIYIAIGNYFKREIIRWLDVESIKYDFIAVISSVPLIIFCIINYRGVSSYGFDMKMVYYPELLSAIIIPGLFGIVLFRIIHTINQIDFFFRINESLAFCGQVTIPIMFLHKPLNSLIQPYISNTIVGAVMYIAVGVGIPMLMVFILGRFRVWRLLLGLPSVTIEKKEK